MQLGRRRQRARRGQSLGQPSGLALGARRPHRKLQEQRGRRSDAAALATARNQLPGGPAAKAAFDAAVALGKGKRIQDAAFAAAGGVLPRSPYAADALSFARRVAAGENIGKAALSTAGKAVVDRLERQGVKVLGAARQRAAGSVGAAMRREQEFGFEESGAGGLGFEVISFETAGAGGAAPAGLLPASGVWLRRGRQLVLYGV